MKNTANLSSHVPTLQQLMLEQQHMIETLKEQLRLALRRQFGLRHEHVNIDQLGLFAVDDAAASDTVSNLEASHMLSRSITVLFCTSFWIYTPAVP